MQEEFLEYQKHGVGEEVSLAECYRATGYPLVSCRWRMHNKCDQDNMKVRARLVAREMKRHKIGWVTIFEGTSTLWSFRALVSSSRTTRRQRKGIGPRTVRNIDTRRAFCHSGHSGRVHVSPPHLVGIGKCWKLRKSMYGTSFAAGDLYDKLVRVLKEDLHTKGGESNPCLYDKAARELKVAFHGDDVAAEGHEEHLAWFTMSLVRLFELETKACAMSGGCGG